METSSCGPLVSGAVAGLPVDASFTRSFAVSVVSVVVAGCAGVVALALPRVKSHSHVSALDELGAASPLAEPAYSSEDFSQRG